jgi:hypothetical protein
MKSFSVPSSIAAIMIGKADPGSDAEDRDHRLARPRQDMGEGYIEDQFHCVPADASPVT